MRHVKRTTRRPRHSVRGELSMIGRVYTLRGDYPAAAVRVDRSTPWGNPFYIGEHGTRAEVIEQHQAWFDSKIQVSGLFRAQVAALAGKDLLCWCAPEACHADLIARRATELAEEDEIAYEYYTNLDGAYE